MIVPALMREDDLRKCFIGTIDDLHYKYYYCESQFIPELDTTVNSRHQFVFVDDITNEVTAYFSYDISTHTNSAYNIGFISFRKKPSYSVMWDFFNAFNDMFTKFNVNKATFGDVSDNPAVKWYYRFVKDCNGDVAGKFKQHVWCYDNSIHDYIAFEIMKEEYMCSDMYGKIAIHNQRKDRGSLFDE